MKARYKTVVDELAHAIRSGKLAAGERLMTHRRLAAEKRISLATASRVYKELEAMGLASGETGRGTFVRDMTLSPGLGIDQPAAGPDAIDLNFNSPTLPDQAGLLREALRQMARGGDIDALLRYQPHAGRTADRECVVDYLRRYRLNAGRENVLLVSGAQHGLNVAIMAMLSPGDVVAVDALTYPGFKVLATLFHLELAPIPVTPAGPDLGALRQLCQTRRVRAIYTMPTLHNPLGWVLNETRRRELVAVARMHDLLILEDAAYAFLVANPPPPLAALAPERTLYITGFSKSIATGLRVGALVAPSRHVPAIERAIRATSWNTPALVTALVCNWIKDGTAALLEQQKREDARRRQRLVRGLKFSPAPAGHENSYFSWLPLGEDVRAEPVVRLLMDEGISVSTAAPFSTTAHPPQALRLALGSVSLDNLLPALAKVKAAIEYARDL